MELIIGGAWQGKSAFARQSHPDIVFREAGELDRKGLLTSPGILNLQDYIRKELEAEKDMKTGGDSKAEEDAGAEKGLRSEKKLSGLAADLIDKNPHVVIVVQETGCGLVPTDPFERAWREQTGRICSTLAACSQKVTRVVCGIPTVLKP